MRRPLTCALLLLAVAPAAAQAGPGDVLVTYKDGTTAAERVDAREDAGVRHEEALPTARTAEVVDPVAGTSVAEAVAALEDDPDVLFAEPDPVRRVLAVPDDRFFGAEWGLRNVGQVVGGEAGTPGADIDAPTAWDTTTGSEAVTIAVVDTGVAGAHPDLAPNVVPGYDFAGEDADPSDLNGHGTHVAGTIGARGGDGTGVAGVTWRSKLLPLRVLDAEGSGAASAAIEAYAFARRSGARVVNLSLGGSSGSRTERDALAAASDVLFVAAAGNDGADNDVVGSFPCDYDLPNVLCVAASDRDDRLASFSNRGARSVDLAAPGVAIASTWLDGAYALLDGTSMAAPHVSGAAALLLAKNPAASVAQLRAALLEGVDVVPGLQGVVVTGGRLDVARSLAALPAAADGAAPPAPAASTPGTAAAPPSSSSEAQTAASPVAQPPDRRAPIVTVSLTPRRDLRALVRRGERVRVTCSERCTVRADLVVDTATRRALRRSSALLARARGSRTTAGAVTVVVRPSRATRTAIGRRATLRATVRVVARDPSGNTRTTSRRVTLRR